MTKRFLALFVLSAGFCLACASASAVTIMPFGDSVTANGSNPESSYRYWLYTSLTNAGYDVDFVGSKWGVQDGSPANDGFDQNFEGGDGWTSEDGVNNISWIAAQTPDIVLLDLGANDIGQAWETADLGVTTTNLMEIVEGFRALNPNVVVVMAQPTRWITTDPNEKKAMSRLGSAVAKAAKYEKKAGANVRVVGLAGGFSPTKDTKDGVHPNLRGEQKIARKYFSAIRRILGRP
jgi:lysophospholipase L1-like esterase